MRPGFKLGAYGLILAVMFGIGAAVGSAVGPLEIGDEPAGHEAPPTDTEADGHGAEGGHGAP
ncbi:MAG TPA: hypothetical protein VIR58_15750 [Acidimicrobiales bacterium]